MIGYVSVKLSGGFGNQLFQIAAMLGYAERTGRTPVFFEPPPIPKEHARSAFRIRDMFPDIPLLKHAVSWEILKEASEDVFTYKSLPNVVGEHVLLEGYFQCPAYGPKQRRLPLPPAPKQLHPALIPLPWHDTFFLHVRRGDYLSPYNRHHCVDLLEYYRTCLKRMNPAWTCFVVSDDIAWCKQNLKDLWKGPIEWCPEECTDEETFFWLTAAERGGICANSTFSWWAAYFQQKRDGVPGSIFMPTPWGLPPFPPVRDLYPDWAIVEHAPQKN